eukprot:364401-Chlamydomonas_euryale.AAC.7
MAGEGGGSRPPPPLGSSAISTPDERLDVVHTQVGRSRARRQLHKEQRLARVSVRRRRVHLGGSEALYEAVVHTSWLPACNAHHDQRRRAGWRPVATRQLLVLLRHRTLLCRRTAAAVQLLVEAHHDCGAQPARRLRSVHTLGALLRGDGLEAVHNKHRRARAAAQHLCSEHARSGQGAASS